jgi:CobN/Magnesium Chelatase
VSLPEIDGAIEPIIFAGREGATGRSVPLADRVNLVADRAMKWASLRKKQNKDKKVSYYTVLMVAMMPCDVTACMHALDSSSVGVLAHMLVQWA